MNSTRTRFTLAVVFFLASAWSVLGQEAVKKTPVPADAVQAASTKLVKEIYGDEYAKAKTATEKRDLAKKLLEKAGETKDDPAGQFVLLRLARDIAAQARDEETAFQAIDAMAETFQVDELDMKTAVLTKLAVSAQKPSEHASIANAARDLADQAVSQETFTVAEQLGKLAIDEARKAHDKDLAAQAQSRIADAAKRLKAYENVKAARDVLAKSPNDPDANLVVGKYLCFVNDDWEKGLPMLARGKDEPLKALAEQELRGAASSTEQAKLGDDWWSLAAKEDGTKEDGTPTKLFKARAGYWYRQALPGLSGLMKDKVEKRVAQWTAELLANTDKPGRNVPTSKPGIVATGNILLGGKGVTVEGATRPEVLFDGAGGKNYAESALGQPMIIRLDKAYKLQLIRILLWHGNKKRFYRYTLETSEDGKKFVPLEDRSQGEWRVWQDISFEPRKVKAIKLTGLYNSQNKGGFHMLEIEAYCIPPKQ